MKLLNTKGKLKLKKIIISFFVLIFSFYTVVPAFANSSTNQIAVSQTKTATPSAPKDQKTVAVPGGATETGRVLCFGLPDPTGLCDAVGGVAGAILSLPQKLFEFIMTKLVEIIAKIITFSMHIIASALGLDTSVSCDPADAANYAQCQTKVKAISEIDPLFSPEAKIRFNAFNLIDQSYGSLYANIPTVNPITEVQYIAGHNLLGVGTAHAQGIGTQDMGNIIRQVWEKMRDLSYIFTAIILVVIGLMVMLRRRLDPRTVVTATSALPKVAIALVLITFSFAISGLMIDFIYVLVSLTRNYFGGLDALDVALKKMGSLGGGELTWLPVLTFISRPILNWGVFLVTVLPAVIAVSPFTGPTAPLVLLIPIIAALGLELIIRIGLLILAIMLFWAILIRFATMIILTIFSPFFFLAGAIPGFESITFTWFKRMLSSVLVFPAILIIVYVALALLSPFDSSTFSIFGIGPNDVQAPPPLGAAKNIVNISPLIGLGFLYFAAKIPGIIDDVIGLKNSRDKGVSPMILVGGAMSGLQTYGAISKSANPIGSRLAQMAGGQGISSRLAGGALTFVRPFAGPGGIPTVETIKKQRANQPQPAGQPLAPNLTTQRGGSAASGTGAGSVPLAPVATPPASPPRRGILGRFRRSGTGGNQKQDPNENDPNDNPNFRP